MCEGVTRECMPPHDHERPTLYLGASLAFERTTEHKSFRIPGTPVSSVNTGWEASEISIRDSIRSATKLDNVLRRWSDDFCSYTSCDGRKPCVCRQLDCVSFLRDRSSLVSPAGASDGRDGRGPTRGLRGLAVACRGARAGSRRVSRFRVLVRLLSVLPGPGTPPEASAARRRTDYGASRLREPSAPARPRRRAAWRPRGGCAAECAGVAWRARLGYYELSCPSLVFSLLTLA